MTTSQHSFTEEIIAILESNHPRHGRKLLESNRLIQYLNLKTKAVHQGAKTRTSFANHYALYVLVEDYVKNGFHARGGYSDYEGALFSELLERQKQLPFGEKLEGHAFNYRMNEEFKKHFPDEYAHPIIQDNTTSRYWINEELLSVTLAGQTFNLAQDVLQILDAYIAARVASLNAFMGQCRKLATIDTAGAHEALAFIRSLLRPDVDVGIFEIISYAILKEHYSGQAIYWGWSRDDISEDFLILYKTGIAKTHDGGIHFVMKPLGRFFQVTEAVDVAKYFSEIDKIYRYPITFVVKSNEPVEALTATILGQAERKFGKVRTIVDQYMKCVEEIINIPSLTGILEKLSEQRGAAPIVQEIVLQSKLEFDLDS